MERAARSLAKLKDSGTISPDQLALAAWPVAVGERIALHARAVALVRGNLVIEAEDGIWQKQLFFLRPQILRKIHELIGNTTVTDVEFRIPMKRRPPQMAMRVDRPADASLDEADRISDPGLRIIYKQARKKAAG